MLTSLQIFERSNFSSEVGAALTLSPNCTRVLRELGFDFKKGDGVRQQYIRKYNAVTFSTIFNDDYGDVESLCGAPWVAMHRQDLHKTLWDLALQDDGDSELPVKLHTGVVVSHVDTENASIELHDGRKFSGDLLIGADGLRSVVRAAAVGSKTPPIDTEWQIYRFLLPTEKIMEDALTKSLKVDNALIMFDIPDSAVGSKFMAIWYECRKYANPSSPNFHL
jgi:salicylate hydroxylase